ncbi:carbamoyltransferase family protein [Streptomyces albidoflavus]|uniref:carbamoyltransferase family protein n=1 Tax=Streptomyces albidoflavus TaxID=1886 RepID=UPI001F5C2F20|nr:carbamoyltransferase C-terminal domain-containing protein [Streptomyces albidoflavus]
MTASPDEPVYLGISLGPIDPSVAAVRGGRVVAYAEEERFVRDKHADGRYPIRSLKYCLAEAGVTLDGVAGVGVGWDLPAYTDGTMAKFYAQISQDAVPDQATLDWQAGTLRTYHSDVMESVHHRAWRREFGDLAFPPLRSAPHHYTHAFQAAMESPFETAVTLTADGSGDQHTTVVWLKRGTELRPIREIRIPHSLGWFYAAFTEYLGFEAYDGEYKVMGLAAHGSADPRQRERVGQVLREAPDGVEYRLDPSYIHHGEHSYSGRFTDKLPQLLGAPPRLPGEEVTDWHMDLAYAVQEALEEAACRLVRWAIAETGVRNVCIGGGVAHNVKMNSRVFELPEVEDVFAHPLCADSGGAAGAALVLCHTETGAAPGPLRTLALGPAEPPETVERVLRNAKIRFEEPEDVFAVTSRALADGAVVGWVEGRLEAGPRALGQRSILADPRSVATRDKVNEVVKQRELWRPFAPAMTASAAGRYFPRHSDSRFMTMAFRAGEALATDAPAVVHSDGTSRVQLVHEDSCPQLHRLLEEFGRQTGVPVLLNTSFNVRGEPIVNTTEDALRTFWATGLDLLVLGGRFVVRKADS